ncbi:alpha-1,6-mannosyl-glycoprotein 2-beta-N-acetylglucosaminyltransferase-like isoform X2 [Sipha flava]|uniref:Alpha-1,6-mannosyl-glycoprotein 2-beta-N-acetylglucosaminyltransferase n=1 Tax=Sipha flava TaxID=143950 RepID=A0A8B8GRB5_9HEMI|nr:alpha-1,6-mannosyl-glycoprotein 2-beta-N-acetylglucosaminyltransferase-like isoform X2 [Sipha flava]
MSDQNCLLTFTYLLILVMKRIATRCLRRWTLVYGVILIIFIITQYHKSWSKLLDLHIGMQKSKNIIECTLETQELFYRNQKLKITNCSIIDGGEGITGGPSFDNVRLLKRIVERLNYEQTIRNLDVYGPLNNNSLIVLIQVHTRINYLAETISSLSQARGIEDVLLIFSHDYYDMRINDLVRSINFCKTMQIYFPYSMQIYTDVFPGQSPHDCPPKITRAEAIEMNCTNAMFPDLYGNYRNATATQVKHHWWWKINTVFDRLTAIRYYTGSILFIEEDHYIVKDFIYMLRLMQKTCPQSKIFSLGIHSDYVSSRKSPQIHVSNWISNLGISFNRSVWNELIQCTNQFCYYDDYNWDWSLQKMTKTCPGHTFWTSTLQNSRVYHLGKCGMHHANNCTDMSHIVKLKQNLNTLKLYPETVDVTLENTKQMPISGFGGWGDTRDHKLCMHMMNHYDVKTQIQNRFTKPLKR